mmetsp:Transcript_29677/g.61249  ORF Transcript_29677/g.61249 Transcript_29677/m.61249 type:complete len:84 (+) Transcript_29677:45-296(+)
MLLAIDLPCRMLREQTQLPHHQAKGAASGNPPAEQQQYATGCPSRKQPKQRPKLACPRHRVLEKAEPQLTATVLASRKMQEAW